MRRIAILGALAFGLAASGVAEAAYRSGTYTGRTSQAGRISFYATQTKLRSLSIQVGFACTDGDRFTMRLTGFPPQNVVPRVVRGATRGVYDASFTGSSGASRYRHRGYLLGRTARGTFTGRRTYNTQNELDPQGTIVCVTGTISYTIYRPL